MAKKRTQPSPDRLAAASTELERTGRSFELHARRRLARRPATPGARTASWILKPGVGGFDDHDLNEHLCLDAARRAGLPAARTTIERFVGEAAVVVTRYDRRPGGQGPIVWAHQEDLCQASGIPPERKYQNDTGPHRPLPAHLYATPDRGAVQVDGPKSPDIEDFSAHQRRPGAGVPSQPGSSPAPVPASPKPVESAIKGGFRGRLRTPCREAQAVIRVALRGAQRARRNQDLRHRR